MRGPLPCSCSSLPKGRGLEATNVSTLDLPLSLDDLDESHSASVKGSAQVGHVLRDHGARAGEAWLAMAAAARSDRPAEDLALHGWMEGNEGKEVAEQRWAGDASAAWSEDDKNDVGGDSASTCSA